MTFKKFTGILGFILAVAVAGSSSYFLADIVYADSVFYSRLFVLLVASLLAGWLIGEGFERKASFRLGLLGMLLGVLGALSHEMFFVHRKIPDAAQFSILVTAMVNGLIVSSFVLFGRNSSALRFAGEVEVIETVDEEEVQPDVAVTVPEAIPDPVEETKAVQSLVEEPVAIQTFVEEPQVIAEEPLPEKGVENDDANSEKEAIFEATLFEKNAELLVEKAKLEAEKILFAAEQELNRITREKEKVENELKLLVRTEKQLLEQYRGQQ